MPLDVARRCRDPSRADDALRIYFVNLLQRTDWHRRPHTAIVDEQGQTNPLAALEELRLWIGYADEAWAASRRETVSETMRAYGNHHAGVCACIASSLGCGDVASEKWPDSGVGSGGADEPASRIVQLISCQKFTRAEWFHPIERVMDV